MQKLENMVRRNFIAILLLLLLGGFITLLAELLITSHSDGIQNVAIVASVVGAIAVLAGLFVKGRARHVVALLLLVLSISGLLGMRQHAEAASEAYTAPALATIAEGYQTIAAQAGTVESAPQQGGPREESAPPPLAPLSLSGLALMGVVVLLAKQDA